MTSVAQDAEIERLQARVRRLADEKSYLQLVIRLIERLNPLPGIADMVRNLLQSIMETVGGTNVELYYWVDAELYYTDFAGAADFAGSSKTQAAIDDPLVAEALATRKFLERATNPTNAMMPDGQFRNAWTWVFPLEVGQELIGAIKLENLIIDSLPLRDYLPIFFNHASLLLSNEIRNLKRERAEAALAKSEARFRRLVKVAPIPLCYVTKDGVIEDFNDRFAQVFGYTHEDIPTLKEWWRLAYPDEAYRCWVLATWDAAVQAAAESGQDIQPVEYQVSCKNGDVRTMEISGVTLGDDFLATFIDITARKQATDAQARSHAELLRFSEISAHHLQEPARRMAIYAERLTAQLAGRIDDAESRLSLEYIGQQARRQQNLLRDVERFLAADQPRGDVRDIDARKMVAEMLGKMADHIIKAGAEVTLGDLPTAHIDAPRLNDLFAVALDNALEHGQSERSLRIAIEGERIGNRVCYSVADNGPGVEPEYRDQLFHVFERLTTVGEGTGIGLSILRRVAESSGGRAWIEETSGGGCRVLFELPAGVIA